MSTIRCIYHPNPNGTRRDPGFPATDQHPQAVRYPFDHPTAGLLNVDALNGAPSQAEIDAILNPPPAPRAPTALEFALIKKGVIAKADVDAEAAK